MIKLVSILFNNDVCMYMCIMLKMFLFAMVVTVIKIKPT